MQERKAQTIVGPNGTASVHLTLAVCDYEHVREITQGLVRADGITLTPLIFPSIEEITFRFTKGLEWDISELSFGKYISLTSQGNAPMGNKNNGVEVNGNAHDIVLGGPQPTFDIIPHNAISANGGNGVAINFPRVCADFAPLSPIDHGLWRTVFGQGRKPQAVELAIKG